MHADYFYPLGNAIDADIFLVDMSGKTLICTHRRPATTPPIWSPESIVDRRGQGNYREMGRLGGIYTEPLLYRGRAR